MVHVLGSFHICHVAVLLLEESSFTLLELSLFVQDLTGHIIIEVVVLLRDEWW